MSGWATTRRLPRQEPRGAGARRSGPGREGNDYLIGKTDEALEVLQKKHYPQVPLADFKEQYGAQKVFPAAEWRKLYADGTVTQVAAAGDGLLRRHRQHPQSGAGLAVLRSVDLHGRHQGAEPLRQESGLRLHHRRRRLGGLRARQPAVRGPALRVLLLEAGGRDRNFWLRLPVGYFRTIYDERFSRLFPTEPSRRHGRAQHRLAARPRARRLAARSTGSSSSAASTRTSTTGRGRAPTGWSYATCCRTSASSSASTAAPSEYRGAHGELARLDPAQRPSRLPRVGRGGAAVGPAAATATSTARRPTASAPTSSASAGGWRESAAVAFLQPGATARQPHRS